MSRTNGEVTYCERCDTYYCRDCGWCRCDPRDMPDLHGDETTA